ncbi:MAG: TraB/GumN family protein [Arthrospira sp. PLM2.Bin9]|nr:TraB/GumN family protein [Arthrospira sp. PLM2.Bin9]TVU54409.1 MAG: TraB/GumN family protein [Arthrospira sp. PLM2.Bin9]
MRKFIKSLLVTTLGKLVTTGLITALVVIYASHQVTHLHAAESKHFLWSVETPQNQVYFLGSIHVLSADDYPLPQVMTDAFNQADNVVFELNINDLESLESQDIMLEIATPPDGKTLLDLISDETYHLVQKTLEKLQYPIHIFASFKPWFVSMSLMSLQLQNLGFDPLYGVDRYFFEQAIAQDKTIISLETMSDQLNIFDSLSWEQQDEMLRQTLKEIDTLENSFQQMLQAWKSGDKQTLENLIITGFKDYPELGNRLFRDRHIKWMTEIQKFLEDDKNYLVVVGAGHLVGEDSIIQMLRDQGYSVQQQ